ncbi:MAG: protein kinase [Anaerolineales bacterium]|nr:protein kinase [Anaerolineales bacterium]
MDLIGMTIGGYQILEEISRGGMAIVYKAYQPSFGRYVAVKVLPAYFQHDTEFLRRFLGEARRAASLRHPNIVATYEASQADGYYYVAMEYMGGGNLASRLQAQGRLSLEDATTAVSQIAAALDYAHDQGVIHRDVKPSNILFDQSGQAKLADFGIAKAAGQATVTMPGTLVGTPEYMSPEQGQGQQVDERTDIWSLGGILYQMLTGRLPFAGDNPHATLYQVVHQRHLPASSLNRELPREVDRILDRALQKSPQRRYRRAGEMASALRRMVHRTTEEPTVLKGEVEPPTTRLARKALHIHMSLWLIFGGLAALLIVVVLVFGVGSLISQPEMQLRATTQAQTAIAVAQTVTAHTAAEATQTAVQAAATKTAVAVTRTAVVQPTAGTAAPIFTATPTPTPTPTPTSTPTLMPTATPPPTATPTPVPKPTASPKPKPPALTGRGFDYGIQAHFIDQDHTPIINAIKDLGFRWVKQQIRWEDLEPSRGNIKWGEMDRLVNSCTGAGIKILFSVVTAPKWARPGNTDFNVDGPPADPQDLANFVAALAERYKGQVQAYEIWNEQNLHYEWGNEALDAGRYVQLLAACYRAIKAKDPGAIVVSGALTPCGDNPPLAVDDLVYLEQMYQAGLKNYCDAVGVHPSGYNVPPDADWRTWSDPSASFRGPADNHHHSWVFRGTMEGSRNVMVVYGDSSKRLWPTEFGWATTEGMGVEPNPGHEYAADNTEAEQAQYIVRAYQLAKNWGWVGPMFCWNLNFWPVAGAGSEEAKFSIVRGDWSTRPAYVALRDMPIETPTSTPVPPTNTPTPTPTTTPTVLPTNTPVPPPTDTPPLPPTRIP